MQYKWASCVKSDKICDKTTNIDTFSLSTDIVYLLEKRWLETGFTILQMSCHSKPLQYGVVAIITSYSPAQNKTFCKSTIGCSLKTDLIGEVFFE